MATLRRKMGHQTTLTPNKVQQLSEIVTSNDFVKNHLEGYAGNKAAITRTRVQLSAIAKMCKEAREELQKVKKSA